MKIIEVSEDEELINVLRKNETLIKLANEFHGIKINKDVKPLE